MKQRWKAFWTPPWKTYLPNLRFEPLTFRLEVLKRHSILYLSTEVLIKISTDDCFEDDFVTLIIFCGRNDMYSLIRLFQHSMKETLLLKGIVKGRQFVCLSSLHFSYFFRLFPIRESGLNWHAQELQLHEIDVRITLLQLTDLFLIVFFFLHSCSCTYTKFE